jgi:tetratricopeptide (TPR) repeat protein
MEMSREQEISQLLERGKEHYRKGAFGAAANDFGAVVALDPDNEEALYNQGLIYIRRQNFLAAEQNFEKMMEISPETMYGRLGYAVLEKIRGNYTESERIYNYLINKMPREWQLYASRADLYFMTGRNARAMDDLNKVFAESEPTASLYVLRGKVKLARYERASAAIDFKKAKEMGYDAAAIDELMKLTW